MTTKSFDICPEAVAERHNRAAAAFFHMEAEISNLVRMADLAMHIFHDEFGVNADHQKPVRDDGHVLPVILEDIQRRAKNVRQRYRDHD